MNRRARSHRQWGMTTTLSDHPEPGERDAASKAPKASRRRWRWLHGAVALAAMGISYLLDAGAWAVVPLLFVLVVPFEKLFPRHKGQRIRRDGVKTDIGFALVSPLMNVVTAVLLLPVALFSLAWIPGLVLRPVLAGLPPLAVGLAGVALFDLAIYWAHRWSHEIPMLWKFHAIHHSPKKLDWVSGFRNHPFDGAILAPAIAFLLAAGFSFEFTGALAIIQIVTGLFLHANVRWRLRVLHPIIITPEFHHWHHANEPEAHNSNHSVFLPLWDIIFGTYYMPADKRPQVYGIDDEVPDTIVGLVRHPLRGTGNPLALVWSIVRHPIGSAKAWFRFCRNLGGEMLTTARRPRANVFS